MARTATPTAGNTAIAIRASTHSRRNITTIKATMVPTCRTAITSTVEDRRASRFTSTITRVISSAECREAKKASGMEWMCAYNSPRMRAITRSPTEAMRYDCPKRPAPLTTYAPSRTSGIRRSIRTSRWRKISSIAGLTSQAMKASEPDTTRASRPPSASVGQYGRRYGISRASRR